MPVGILLGLFLFGAFPAAFGPIVVVLGLLFGDSFDKVWLFLFHGLPVISWCLSLVTTLVGLYLLLEARRLGERRGQLWFATLVASIPIAWLAVAALYLSRV